MTTHMITDEEKAFLDSAKKVAQLWGHIQGQLVTSKNRQPAEQALVEMIELGRANVNGQYLCDTTK